MQVTNCCPPAHTLGGYRSIVVGIADTPRSEPAIAAATRLAKDARATLTIVGAYRRVRTRDQARVNDLLGRDAYSSMPVSAMDELLAAAVDDARAAGVAEAVGRSMPGTPIEVLLAAAASCRADLVVVGERVFDASWRRLFGSFHTEVARRSAAHVLIVPRTRSGTTKIVTVAPTGNGVRCDTSEREQLSGTSVLRTDSSAAASISSYSR
ncbi:universal stress protein [Nocardia sp. NPDC006630]|uniref:universal stress protein n=1 Tax=Nocardia sp. NPDC006630 TaxID=3157181 RepID=UPI0033ADFFBB